MDYIQFDIIVLFKSLAMYFSLTLKINTIKLIHMTQVSHINGNN
jgi:hypothetical protein